MRRLVALFCLAMASTQAAENQLHGVVDVRGVANDSVTSYIDGGFGKFSSSDDTTLSLSQLGLSYVGQFDSQFSAHVIGNAYSDAARKHAGLTEAYLTWLSLPSSQGLRLQARAGLMYPKVSMENILTAWASPYTLDYSTINAWLGEEIRYRGAEISVTSLGKFHDSAHDFELSVAAMRYNDPAGAMLAWHGWVVSSRQSFAGEELSLPDLDTGYSPYESKPFTELDHRTGYHVTAQWDWHDHGRVLAGYYDNRADPRVVEDLQWAWTTRFAHIGIKWQLSDDIELITQYLSGDTLMQSSNGATDLVYNEFHSGFVLLSRHFGAHRVTARAEEFAVVDEDDMPGDDNTEYGKAFTVNYSYRVTRACFASAEYSWIRSDRPARALHELSPTLMEQRTQLALRYFF
jgi:hypothetical protein